VLLCSVVGVCSAKIRGGLARGCVISAWAGLGKGVGVITAIEWLRYADGGPENNTTCWRRAEVVRQILRSRSEISAKGTWSGCAHGHERGGAIMGVLGQGQLRPGKGIYWRGALCSWLRGCG